MPTLAQHLRWRALSFAHRRVARAVLRTPPVPARGEGLVVLSMVGGRVLEPYLVAAKSLLRGLGGGRAVVIDDGTLSPADRAALARHMPGVEVLAIDSVDTGACPRGGTWERLLTILDLRADAYVVQVDSDTVTLGAIPEVVGAVRANRSFSLRGEPGAELADAAALAAALPPLPEPMHVQHAAERALPRLALPIAHPRYFRGCSGFAGFARSGGGRALAEAFSRENERLLGPERWGRWGSEQVTSNFVVANDPDPLLLPYDRYLNHTGETVPPDARFVHYLGEWRFNSGSYFDATRRAIRALAAADQGDEFGHRVSSENQEPAAVHGGA